MKRRDFLKDLGLLSAGAAFGGMEFSANAMEESSIFPAMPAALKGAKPLDGLGRNIRSLAPQIGDKVVTCVIVGAGNRGIAYSKYALKYPKNIRVVGVSDIKEFRRKRMGEMFNIPEEARFGDFHEILSKPKMADAMLICLPDGLHYEACMKALELGYDVLLEKPMAQTEKECKNLLAQSKKYNRIVATCHVLRYAPYFIALREAVQSGMIGKVISMQHLEPIEYDHMAHSYVRGNWYDSKATTPIILAKSCHDLDIMRWIIDKPCTDVSAEGDLTYFTAANAPAGAPARCTDGCPHEATCPYSAIRIYAKMRRRLQVFDLKTNTEEEILEKLRTTNYGRCVFHSDNDQPDHYIANFKFGDVTASFSMEAFTPWGGRRTRIMGTEGYIEGDMQSFTLWKFIDEKPLVWKASDVEELPEYKGAGHGGGDFGLARDFFEAVALRDPSRLTSTIDVSVESHVMGFKCEESRLKGRKVKMK